MDGYTTDSNPTSQRLDTIIFKSSPLIIIDQRLSCSSITNNFLRGVTLSWVTIRPLLRAFLSYSVKEDPSARPHWFWAPGAKALPLQVSKNLDFDIKFNYYIFVQQVNINIINMNKKSIFILSKILLHYINYIYKQIIIWFKR